MSSPVFFSHGLAAIAQADWLPVPALSFGSFGQETASVSVGFLLTALEGFTFTCGILCQVWYLIVSIPDLCQLYYFLLI